MRTSMKNWLSKLKPHWRFIAFEFCILLGGLLILPAFRLIPFLLEPMTRQSQSIPQTSRLFREPASPSLTPTPVFNQFIPYFNRGEVAVKNAEGVSLPPPFIEKVNFSPGAVQMTLRIFPDQGVFDSGQPVDISFLPSDRCEFGDGQACIYAFMSSGGGQVIFASVHSGLGAEAENFRDLLEGTGFNRALHDQEKVRKHMQALAGARVSVSQGQWMLNGLNLAAVVRIPPEYMTGYMQTPVEEVLDYAIEVGILDPGILSKDLLVFETCGWRLPGEALVPGVPDTSTSVYLGVIVTPNP